MQKPFLTKEDLIAGCWIAFRLCLLFGYTLCLICHEYIPAGVVLASIVGSCILEEVIAKSKESA